MNSNQPALLDLWAVAATLWRRRRMVIIVTGGAAAASVIISLLLPNWFMAQTRLLLPARTGSGILSSAILGSLPPAASSLLGGITGDYQRYLSILDSRTVKESVVMQFDLATVYDVADSDSPVYAAIQALDSNVEFVVDEEYNHLLVRVYDREPVRAADMANHFVRELNRVNADLASQTAGRFRRYVEQRYAETELELDSVATALEALQQASGLLDPRAQGEVFAEGLTAFRLAAWQNEMQYEALLELYGPEHSAVRSAKSAMDAADKRYRDMLEGQERLMPVAQDSIPAVARQFFELELQATMLGTLLEATRPVVEEARLEEQRRIEAVQVVDAATPPVEKARPRRSVIVVASTLSAFVLVLTYVLLFDWWRRNHARLAARLVAASRA